MKAIQKGLRKQTIDQWENYRQRKIDYVNKNFDKVFYYFYVNSGREKDECFALLMSQALTVGWELNELMVDRMEQLYPNVFRQMHRLGN